MPQYYVWARILVSTNKPVTVQRLVDEGARLEKTGNTPERSKKMEERVDRATGPLGKPCY